MSRIGSLVCPIIVGRDELLAKAEDWIAGTLRGEGRTLFIAGQAGVGKTRLARAIYRKAEAAGIRVEGGAVAPHDRSVPLASILDFARGIRLDPTWGSLGSDVLGIECGSLGDALSRRRTLVLEVADRILEAIDRPTVLSFEDLQWTDELSLEVIGEVARRSTDVPLLTIALYRLDELPIGSTHREWRARLLSQRLADEARLEPLTLEETAVATTLILGTGLPAPSDVVAAVHTRTNGIPLHIEELLGALPDDARLDGARIRDAQVPDTIEDAVLARVARLSPDARQVARAGAVIGRCFLPDVVAGMVDRPLSELEAPLDELVAESILHPFQFVDEGYYDFRHQLLRDAIYGTLPPAQLRRLHAQAAEFGTQLIGASEIHASAHYERAGLRPQAFRAALSAARAANRMSARQEAFELFSRAVDNMPHDLPVAERADLYEAYSDAAATIERNDESLRAAEIARELHLRAGEAVRAAGLLLTMETLAARDAQPVAERIALLDQAALELDGVAASPEGQELVRSITASRAVAELDASHFEAGIEALAAARELAATTGADEYASEAAVVAVRAEIEAGRGAAAIARALEVARAARDNGLEALGVTAYRNLAAYAARILDYETAEVALAEGLRYADAIEQSHCRQQMAATTALLAWARGAWDDAERTARRELAERGCRRGQTGARDILGYVAMGRGELDEARARLDESLSLARASGELQLILPPLWGLAELELIAGAPDRAMECCDEALAAAGRGERSLFTPFVVTGARALIAARRPDELDRWVERATRMVGDWDEAAAPALAHATGLARMAAGQTGLARELLEAAVEGWSGRSRSWEAAWARLALAQCLVRSNRFADAAALVSAVSTFAKQVGSGPLAERADGIATSARGRGFEDEPWRPLTAREFEVARLIADGYTNAEIAEQLDIAPKTSSAHVEHILAKLAVSRRAEIATWVATVAGPGTAPAAKQATASFAVGATGTR